MASNAKKKTTMAKLNRERKLRERRQEKQAKKEARKLAAEGGLDPSDDLEMAGEPGEPLVEPDDPDTAVETPTES